MAEPERKGFASPAYKVESSFVGTICIWGRAGERMEQEGPRRQLQTPSWVCTQAESSVLVSIGRMPARPQQQGCDREKLCQKSPKWHQHCMW